MAVKKQFNSFEALIEGSELPLVVDFYAPWCGPCQLMGPILEQVGAQLKERVQVVKINTDKYPNLSSRYQIRALPTLIVFKQKTVVDRIEGVLSVEQLITRLKPVL